MVVAAEEFGSLDVVVAGVKKAESCSAVGFEWELAGKSQSRLQEMLADRMVAAVPHKSWFVVAVVDLQRHLPC